MNIQTLVDESSEFFAPVASDLIAQATYVNVKPHDINKKAQVASTTQASNHLTVLRTVS